MKFDLENLIKLSESEMDRFEVLVFIGLVEGAVEQMEASINFHMADLRNLIILVKERAERLVKDAPCKPATKEKKVDKEMVKVTEKIEKAKKDVKAGKPKAAQKDLKDAKKKNVQLTKIDRTVRDPKLAKCDKVLKKKK